MIELLENYGHYICKIGEAMDKAGLSVSKMKRLTGLNYDIVKKYYNDDIIRIDKDVLARISFVLMNYGINPNDLIEYIPGNLQNLPTKKLNRLKFYVKIILFKCILETWRI